MTKIAFCYIAALVAFVVIDMVWLAWLAKPTYVAELGKLLRKDPNLAAAAAFYLLYTAGLVWFAILPGIKSGSVLEALALGGALGLVAYGTYDLTNLAVMNGFGLRIALIDMAWGATVSAATTALVAALALVVFSA
jgi:uncharacterized membrane protein